MPETFSIDLDAERVALDGAWYSRDDLAQKIKAMVDAGDYKLGHPSAALEALETALAELTSVSIKLPRSVLNALSGAANRSGKTVDALTRGDHRPRPRRPHPGERQRCAGGHAPDDASRHRARSALQPQAGPRCAGARACAHHADAEEDAVPGAGALRPDSSGRRRPQLVQPALAAPLLFSADLSRGQRLILSAVGGVLLAFSLPTVFPIWGKTELLPGGELTFLAYVGMIPLFVALRGASFRAAFFYGFTAGLAYFSVAIWWIDIAMHTFGGIPNYLAVPVLYLLILFLAVHWGAACMLAVWVGDRLRWPLWLLLPPLWTTFELVRNYLFSGYPWGDLGYTLARYRLTVQWASLFGLYGLAFLVVTYNGALYELGRTLLKGDRRGARLPAVVLRGQRPPAHRLGRAPRGLHRPRARATRRP